MHYGAGVPGKKARMVLITVPGPTIIIGQAILGP